MAKNSIRDYDATSGNNTDVQSVDISEGCAASGINNALREIMTDLKNVSTGAVALETPAADQLNVDNIRIDGNTISSTDTNGNVTIDPAGTGVVAITGGFTATDGCTITVDDNDPTLTLASTDADGGRGPELLLYRNSASPANGDALGFIRWDGENDSGAQHEYIKFEGLIAASSGAATGAEQAKLDIRTMVSGTDRSRIDIDYDGTVINQEARDLDFRVETSSSIYSLFIEGSSGNVGINRSSPATTLDIDGTLTITGTAGRGLTIKSAQGGTGQNDADAVYDAQDTEGGGGGFHKFFVGGNEKARIENDGDIKNVNNSYGAISDQRMKENIVDAASQWDDIKAIQVRKFNMIGSDTTQIGVIAQELEAANMSGLVSEAGFTDDKLNPDGELRKTVKYSVLYMKAIGALQEAIAKIETLETQRADLEARLTALENA